MTNTTGPVYRTGLLFTIFATFLLASQLMAAPAVLWVDNTDRDSRELGSSSDPYLTITRALDVVRAGQTIRVRVGVYSRAKGERFPLNIPARVTLMGGETVVASGAHARMVRGPDGVMYGWPVIYGGKSIAIDAAGTRRFVTLTVRDHSRLNEFVVYTTDSSATADDGVGVLCREAGTATIITNRFRGTGHAGITILETAAPAIHSNKFEGRALVWGVTAHGSGRPDIYQNRFSTSGGIDITQTSRARVRGNTITASNLGVRIQNESNPNLYKNSITGHRNEGILMNDSATPMISKNVITNNGTDEFGGGVVIYHECNPDLGGGAQGGVGSNIIRNNTPYDVMNRSSMDVYARHNTWDHRLPWQIDRIDVYDDDEEARAGRVYF